MTDMEYALFERLVVAVESIAQGLFELEESGLDVFVKNDRDNAIPVEPQPRY